MQEILRVNSISELHDIIGYSKPKHPLITFIDFSKLEFTPASNETRVVMGFYSISLKNQVPGALKYGRGYYDFQEGSLSFIAPEQVITFRYNPDAQEREGWANRVPHPGRVGIVGMLAAVGPDFTDFVVGLEAQEETVADLEDFHQAAADHDAREPVRRAAGNREGRVVNHKVGASSRPAR